MLSPNEYDKIQHWNKEIVYDGFKWNLLLSIASFCPDSKEHIRLIQDAKTRNYICAHTITKPPPPMVKTMISSKREDRLDICHHHYQIWKQECWNPGEVFEEIRNAISDMREEVSEALLQIVDKL